MTCARYASARRAPFSPLALDLPGAAWMVAGAFSFLPPFFGLGSFFSPAAFGSATGPSPAACFFGLSSSCFFFSSAIWISFVEIRALLVELRTASLGDADSLAVLEHLGADAGGLLRLGIDQRQVGDMDAAVPLHDAALGRRRVAAALQVALEDHQLLDDRALLLVIDLEDLAGLALLLAGEDVDDVALLDANRRAGHGYSTSGASEMIFMNLRARSSRATGPKMRVPMGSFSLVTITALLVSNVM